MSGISATPLGSLFSIGDRVTVNGFGKGTVAYVGSYPNPRQETDYFYTVTKKCRCECACGHEHERTDTGRARAIHMRSLK